MIFYDSSVPLEKVSILIYERKSEKKKKKKVRFPITFSSMNIYQSSITTIQFEETFINSRQGNSAKYYLRS